MKAAAFGVLLWLAWLASAAQADVAAPVDMPSGAEQVPVWQGVRVVEETGRLALAPELAAVLAAKQGERIDSPTRAYGRGTSPHWALFSLRNPEPFAQLRLLALETTIQFDTRLFERDEAGEWRLVRSLADAAGGRVGGGTTHPVWELLLAPRRTVDLLLRVEGPAIVRFPVFAYQPSGFVERQRNTHVMMGVALGICLLIGVYIGSLRRYLGDASVPLFICMLTADLIGALWLSGFLSELFPALSERMLSQIGFAAYATLMGCGNLHARVYLNSAAWAPRADRLLQALGLLCLGLAPWFSLAFPVAARIVLVWGGAAVAATLMAVALMATRRNVPFSGFIAAAWLVYLLTSGSFLLARVVASPQLWSPSVQGLWQAMLTALLFGLAMSQRLMRQRDTLVAAHQEAMMEHEKGAALMRERSLFFAATAHDLRQPLVGISLHADLLKSVSRPEERDEHARKLDLALKEVDGLLVGIQQLAAVNQASHRPAMETVKLDDLLAPVIEEYRVRSEYKRITIRYVPTRATVTTHVPYFQRIVRNVLANAVRYTDRGDRILVGCRRGGGLRLVIADTGRGMTEEQTRQAFDAFRRFDAEISSIPDGFGLGLFSAKSLANALGLRVSLKSRRGRGTEFSLSCRPFGEGADGNAADNKTLREEMQ